MRRTPIRWQPGREAKHVAFHAEASKAEYNCLPEPPKPGDPYPAGTVRIEFEVRNCRLAKKTKGNLSFAKPCSDQRVDAGAQGAAMRASWLVIAEVCFPARARELVRQQRQQRHYVGLLDHLRALRLRVAEHYIDRYLAVSVQ